VQQLEADSKAPASAQGGGQAGAGAPTTGSPGGAPAGSSAPPPKSPSPTPAESAAPRPLASKKVEHEEGGDDKGAAAAPTPASLPGQKRVSREQALADVLAEAERLGVKILTDEDPEIKAYMNDAARREGVAPEGMHAITLGSDTIVIRKEYAENVRVLREELIHTQQQMEGLSVGAGEDMITAMELDARRKLLENVDNWALTDEEVTEIAREIATIEKRGRY
jgi:hypothetical protein